MNRRSRGTRLFLQGISILMLIFSIALGVGTNFVEFMFSFNKELITTSYWILFAISTLLTLVMFYSASSISTNKEFSSNDDFNLKVKNIKEVNIITGLEHSEQFLDEHFLDKKYDKVLRKLKNKLEKIKKKADRRGYNFKNPEKQIFKKLKWYRWFNGKHRFDKLYKRYIKIKEKHDSPELKDELQYTYVKGIYRVTKSYLSDGIKNYSINNDPDKPVSGVSVQASKGSQKLAISMIATIFGASIGYKLLDQGFTNDFWIDLAMKLISYLITIVNGFTFGKTYFTDVFLDFEIKRENLLQKYINWLKYKYTDVWNKAIGERKALQIIEAESLAKAKLQKLEEEARAKEIEDSMLEQ